MSELFPDVEMKRSADFSPCGVYRYTLVRVWDESKPRILWVLLNPSTADAVHDDPTNRKGIKFSKAWGFGSCVFVNLFAFRSPHPKVMKKQAEPVGPENEALIIYEATRAIASGGKIVLAWGNDGAHRGRDAAVLKLLKSDGFDSLWCMGKNQGGSPKHPLYLRDDTELEVFDV